MHLRSQLVSIGALLAVAVAACGNGDAGTVDEAQASARDLGVAPAELSPTITHPFVAFASVRDAVFEGQAVDADNGEPTPIRVESTVRNRTTTVAGVEVTVVEVSDFEDGQLIEQTEDYYAQDGRGVVYYMGERVDDYENGNVVGHHGQWLAGRRGNRAGVFMPASIDVGTEFAQEQVPGVAEDRSTIVATGVTVAVPAGAFDDCIESEDYNRLDGETEHKFYCRDIGLVREVSSTGGSLDLVELRR